MTQAIRTALKPYCTSPPDDLVAHFVGSHFPVDPELSINVLRFPQAVKYTAGIHENSILGAPFGLVALDDANNSNPYCYVTKGPTRGAVMHLCHDGEPRIVFSALRDFISAIDAAIADRTDIEDLPHDEVLADLDRAGVITHVSRLITNEGLTEEICVLVPLLRTSDVSIMSDLAKHSDFFVREAVADRIALSPNAALLMIAEQLAADRHPQVARPGKRALTAIAGLKPSP